MNFADPKFALAWLQGEDDADIVVANGPSKHSSAAAEPPASTVRLNACVLDEATTLNACVSDEATTRLQTLLAESEARCELAFNRPIPPGKGRKDLAVFEHNRRLITNDLVRELYESNKDQRDQLKQLFGTVMMLHQRQQSVEQSSQNTATRKGRR